MRFGRIVKIELLESNIVAPANENLDVGESGIIKNPPSMKENWMYMEDEDNNRGYKVTSRWREFVSDEISTNDEIGEFPYNIVKWDHKYDIDIELTTQQTSQQKSFDEMKDLNIDYSEGLEGVKDKISSMDTSIETLEADITIYNPPEDMVKEISDVKLIQRDGADLEEIGGSLSKRMIIKAGYYGKYDKTLPVIFKGKIKPKEGVEYIDNEDETEIRFTLESKLELFENSDKYSGDQSYLSGINFNGKEERRLDNAIKKVVEGSGVSVGRIIYEYTKEETGEDIIMRLPTYFSIEPDTTINDAVLKIVNKIEEKYTLHGQLDVRTEMAGVVSVVPKDYNYYKGIVLTPELGLINFTRSKNDINSSSSDSASEYELETLLLPEIRYGDLIKLKKYEGDEWSYFKVNKYTHNLPHNDSATTTLTCEKLEDVETLYNNEEIYSLNQNQFSKPRLGVT